MALIPLLAATSKRRCVAIYCFESQQTTTFPSPERPRRLAHGRLLSTKRVPVYCVCRLPWNKYDKKRGPLVKCNSCKTWYHQSCLKIKNDVIMNKSIHFCVISVTYNIIVLQLCFMSILLPYYALLLCTFVVKVIHD